MYRKKFLENLKSYSLEQKILRNPFKVFENGLNFLPGTQSRRDNYCSFFLIIPGSGSL